MKELIGALAAKGKTLILGFGKEGRSTYAFLRKNFPELELTIADQDPLTGERNAFLQQDNATRLIAGNHYLDTIAEFSFIIKSPGVAIPGHIKTGEGALVTSQTRLMLEAYHRQIIGITGTKGKSTTTSLTHHLLIHAGLRAVLVGNIGRPPFDYLQEIIPGTLIVFEMSSHQLEDSILAPHISVLLNLFPEHLDRYASIDAYYSAKMRILTGQLDGDLFIYNADIPEIANRIGGYAEHRQLRSFSSLNPVSEGAYLDGEGIVLAEDGASRYFFEPGSGFRLKGRHNLMNAMAAILAARAAGAGDDGILEGLITFGGLEHRLECAGTHAGIIFYNDSIATIPEAAIAALQALPGTDTIILGGYDRGLDYGNLAEFLASSPVRNLIFMGQAGARMLEKIRLTAGPEKSLFMVSTMEEAFEIIPRVTERGKICLLSPAAASYDLYRNFEERGNLFKKLAGNL